MTTDPLDVALVGPDTTPCYCEERDCRCKPQHIAQIDRFIASQPVITTPLTPVDASLMAIKAHGHSSAVWCPICERFADLLQAVDHARGAQDRQDTVDLLGDVLDVLTEVWEFADKYSDVNDGADGEWMPNTAMKIQGRLDDNYGGRGLLSRVRSAWQRAR